MLDSHTPSEAVAKGRDLATTIENIYAHVGPNGKRLSDNLLMYYWDNETLGKDWEVVQTILQSVNDKDGDVSARSGASRSRQRPVYVLQGSYGVARSYDRLVDGSGAPIDVVGTYVRSADDTKSPQLADALVALDKTPGQSVPGAFGQINDRGNVSLTAAELRLSVYNTLIAGGKAIGIFRDPYNGHDKDVGIEYSLWWDELPTLVEEIAELMPIIQEPHWTTWQVFANVDKLGIGTRNHDGHGYILVTNNNPYSVRATFRIEDNAGPARYVIDYFDNDVVATVSESQFEILLLANATRVLELTDTKRNVD
jgi:hypothetical protein